MKHLSSNPLLRRFLALSTNIRLEFKGLPETNALAYDELSKLRTLKKLRNQILLVIIEVHKIDFILVSFPFVRYHFYFTPQLLSAKLPPVKLQLKKKGEIMRS